MRSAPVSFSRKLSRHTQLKGRGLGGGVGRLLACVCACARICEPDTHTHTHCHRCEYKVLSVSARQSIAVIVVTHRQLAHQSESDFVYVGQATDALAHFVNLWIFNDGKRVQTFRRQMCTT